MQEQKLSSTTLASAKLSSVLAGTVAVVTGGGTAEAIDFFNSPVYTSNNVTGYINNNATGVLKFGLDLGLSGPIHQAFIGAVNPGTGRYGVVFNKSAGVPYFKVATYTRPMGTAPQALTQAAIAATVNQDWNNFTRFANNANLAFVTNVSSVMGAVSPKSNQYLLFKFKDSSNDPYYGWADVNIANQFVDGVLDTWVKVNQYAWQKTNPIKAGAVAIAPVPEPSTMITAGIAALTGGSIALRRWRRERKAAC